MSESRLHQIIYLSSATEQLTEESLIRLLSGTQKRNASRHITGLLLYHDGNIIQILEGPEAAVKTLYAKIEKDRRHKGISLICSKAIEARDFPDYRMGFKRMKGETLEQEITGFSDLVERGRIDEAELEGLSKIVATFIKAFARSTKVDLFGKTA